MKKSKNKKMLVMAVLLALFIVVGGTFAWFTSKDEVTNKLTAQNDYGVSIVEDFTPPGDWTPGQEVNKDVYVTNTGNVDAFVKVALSNSMNLTTVAAGGARVSVCPYRGYAGRCSVRQEYTGCPPDYFPARWRG